jgi:hypothetical protein
MIFHTNTLPFARCDDCMLGTACVDPKDGTRSCG